LTQAQVRQIFTQAETWDQIDPTWPAEPIFRFIPGMDSGTLDFFVAEVFGTELAVQPAAVLRDLLTANVSAGRLRALEAAHPIAALADEELYLLVESEVLKPQVAESWSLFESIFNRQEIEARSPRSQRRAAVQELGKLAVHHLAAVLQRVAVGHSHRHLGSLWVTLIAFLLAVPLGVAAAIYLEEYNKGAASSTG
jgi:hypothetical protein